MATLPDALAAIQTVLAAIPGVESVPSDPPEQPSEIALPAIYSYPLSGGWSVGTARGAGTTNPMMWGVHTIAVNCWLARKDLPTDAATAASLAALIPNALMAAFDADGFGGTVTLLGRPGGGGDSPIRYEFAAFRWGGLDLVGYQFQLDIAVEQEVTG